MTEGITCYERDEILCTEPRCLQGGKCQIVSDNEEWAKQVREGLLDGDVPAQRGALKPIHSLINEIAGIWDAFEIGLRQEISNTNYAVVKQKLAEAELAVARLPVAPAERRTVRTAHELAGALADAETVAAIERLRSYFYDNDKAELSHHNAVEDCRLLLAEYERIAGRSPAVTSTFEPLKPPFETYNTGFDVADADGHICSAESKEHAQAIVQALAAACRSSQSASDGEFCSSCGATAPTHRPNCPDAAPIAWRRVRDDGIVTFWETPVPDSEPLYRRSQPETKSEPRG